MSWYRRSNTISRYLTSKLTTSKPPIPPPIPLIKHTHQLTSPFSPMVGTKDTNFRLFGSDNSYRRYYYVDTREVKHYIARGFKKWIDDPSNVLVAMIMGAGVGVTLYFGSVETIPYTKRRHLVLLSHKLERTIGESAFQKKKVRFKGKILGALHPESVRVSMISKDVIEALQRRLKKEKVWSDLNYATEGGGSSESRGKESVMAMKEGVVGGEDWKGKDESRKKGRDKEVKPGVTHLEGMKWEVLVVNDNLVNAFCLPGGKIVVFTGLLDHFKTNEEIATIIGHEVAHVVARHSAEQITKNLWFTIGTLFFYHFLYYDLVNMMSYLLLKLPFSRRMEIEADYIGLLLMASAGYDPRNAPKVYEKLGEVSGGDYALRDYLSTHPSGKRRSKLLSEAKCDAESDLYIPRGCSRTRG